MKKYNNVIMKKGFTLMEVIVAIFLITLGIGGAYVLISQTVSSATISSQKLIASYLVQEGIEIVRNIRDGNWLEQRTATTTLWNEGLTNCSAGCIADYNTPTTEDPTLDSYTGQVLNIDTTNGFYSCSTTPPFTPTKFKRKITITPEGIDILKVIVQVEWLERGRTHRIKAQENLYNWR